MRGFLESKTLNKRNYQIKKWYDTDFSMDVEVSSYPEMELPFRSSPISPVYEFPLPSDVTIFPQETRELHTDVRLFCLPDEYLKIFLMVSGLEIKSDVIILNGCNNIKVVVKNFTPEIITIEEGQVFLGGIFHKYLFAVNDHFKENDSNDE